MTRHTFFPGPALRTFPVAAYASPAGAPVTALDEVVKPYVVAFALPRTLTSAAEPPPSPSAARLTFEETEVQPVSDPPLASKFPLVSTFVPPAA